MAKIRKKRRRTSDRVTLEDIALRCNVSKATVSRVLNDHLNDFPVSEKMIQRVKAAAAELDYRPNRLAQAIRSQKTNLIGLSCAVLDSPNGSPDRIAYDDQMLGNYINIILTHPGFEDYDLVIHYRKESDDRPLRPSDFKADLLDGMIYLTPSENHNEFLSVASESFPIVLLGQVAEAEKTIPCIDINNRKMGKQAVEHLIGLGRKNILMLTPEKLQHLTCLQDRVEGYRDALTDHGLPVSNELIHSVRSLKESVSSFFKELHHLENVDAIFCSSDDLAVHCIEPLKSMGYRIPEDIAIIGFDNMTIAQHTAPPLSSVRRPSEKQVYAATDLLLKILNKEIPYEPEFHEIETELVIRESSKAE